MIRFRFSRFLFALLLCFLMVFTFALAEEATPVPDEDAPIIVKTPLTIILPSAEKFYDATPLSIDNADCTITGLLDGDSITTLTCSGSQTVVGTSDVTLTNIQITNASGENVTSHYTISATPGSLTVHPISLTSQSVFLLWDDNADQDGLRAPVTVTLTASAGGNTLSLDALSALAANGASAAMTSDGQHVFTGETAYTYTGLPVYWNENDPSTAISYSVQATSLPEGYTVQSTGNTLTLSHTPQLVSRVITVHFDDQSNLHGHRKDLALTLHATSAGNTVSWGTLQSECFGGASMPSNQLTISADLGEIVEQTISNLPRCYQGSEIAYSVTVDATPRFYLSATSGLTVQLTHVMPIYTWSADYNTCTATLQTQTGKLGETIPTESFLAIEATCLSEGERTYLAEFSSSWATTQVMHVPVRMLGHWYSDWNSTGMGTHEAHCQRSECDATASVPCTLYICQLPDQSDPISLCPVCGVVNGEAVLQPIKGATSSKTNHVAGELSVHVGQYSTTRLMTVVVEFGGYPAPLTGLVDVRLPASVVDGYVLSVLRENGVVEALSYRIDGADAIFSVHFSPEDSYEDLPFCLIQMMPV